MVTILPSFTLESYFIILAIKTIDSNSKAVYGNVIGNAKEAAGERIWQEIQEVSDGKLMKAEVLGHTEFSINRIGPSL
jgi:altronate dehydratase